MNRGLRLLRCLLRVLLPRRSGSNRTFVSATNMRSPLGLPQDWLRLVVSRLSLRLSGQNRPHTSDHKGSFRYPAPPGASGPSTAYTSPASSALPTPSAHSYPAQGGCKLVSNTCSNGDRQPTPLSFDRFRFRPIPVRLCPAISYWSSWILSRHTCCL